MHTYVQVFFLYPRFRTQKSASMVSLFKINSFTSIYFVCVLLTADILWFIEIFYYLIRENGKMKKNGG